MGGFEEVFKHVKDSSKKDPHSKLHRASDVDIGGNIPYGILSGIPRLDFSIGRPGLPVGRVIEFFGFEMSGKTTAAFHALAQAQRAGGGGLYIDAEFAWDEERARDVGIDPDVNFAIAQVDTIEGIYRQIQYTIDGITKTGFDKPFIIVVDSVTAVTTEHEYEKEIGEVAKVGIDAKVIRDNMRKIMPKLSRSNVCLIFINHAISKVGAMQYAKQSQSSGGHAIKFYSTLRCEFTNAGQIKDESIKDGRAGQKINITIEKLKRSRLARPKIKEVALLNTTGFDLIEELFNTGKDYNFIEKVNQMTYRFGDIEFIKKDWPQVVKDQGGANKVYDLYIELGKEKGLISPWSEWYVE